MVIVVFIQVPALGAAGLVTKAHVWSTFGLLRGLGGGIGEDDLVG